MLIAVTRPYGGLINGSPNTVVGGRFARPRAGASPAAGAGPPPPAGAPGPGPPPRTGGGRVIAATSTTATTASTFTAAAAALDKVHVRSRRIVHQGESCRIGGGEDVDDAGLRIECTTFPVGASGRRRQHQETGFASVSHRDRRREDWSNLVKARDAERFGFDLRRPIVQIGL